MTTEQREAIDKLKNLLAKGKYGIAGKMLLYDDYYMLKNVLKVVENQEQKIVKQQEEIKKKDKQIDLITDEFYKKAKISIKCYLQESVEECMKYKNCKECLKQYFARLVEKE